MMASDATWSQISSGSHSRQMPWGENIDESRIRSKNVDMIQPCCADQLRITRLVAVKGAERGVGNGLFSAMCTIEERQPLIAPGPGACLADSPGPGWCGGR